MQIALTHVVSSTGMTYVNVISIPTKEHSRCAVVSQLIPQVAPVRLMLHGQCCIRYENIFTS
jgi:hypothetical protein